MRERLFVGVLTSKETINTMGVAVNRTIHHHLENVVFFTGLRSPKTSHGMSVVAHGDELLNLYNAVKYILEHYISEYDWFYLAHDNTYTQADRLKSLASHLSMDYMLYMGSPVEFTGDGAPGTYCDSGSGLILSRALLLRLQPFLAKCRGGTSPDETLGKCINRYLGANCVDEHKGLYYHHFKMGQSTDASQEDSVEFKDSLTVHPVSNPEQMYRLHKHFTQLELQKTYEEIQKLQAEIKNVSVLAADGKRSAQWPVGVSPPFEPKQRFDVLRWDFFTEDLIYSCIDDSPQCELRGVDETDVADVIETAMRELNKKYMPVLHLKKQHVINGYRRFDPNKGMEYTLDLQLEAVTQDSKSRSITKRVHLVRPLSNVEIIPMPYVTEAAMVHIILPLTMHDKDFVDQFLEMYAKNCLEKKENAVLTLVFICDAYDAQQANQCDLLASIKSQISDYKRRFPSIEIPLITITTDAPSQIKVLDIVSKQLPLDTLFFTATVNTNISGEFLNRCRMNSINNWQVFFPIHFQDYNPSIAYHGLPSPTMVDLVRDSGHFDRSAFDEACFYNSDYMATRNRMAQDVLENEDLLDTLDFYDMIVQYSGLHVFRAVEPALHQRYNFQLCNPQLSDNIYHRCVLRNMEALGTRSQLAMVLFEQEYGKST
ncbi:chondroitin sulfate synthase 2 isoform X2 [Denticeps clupeoides]|nr:chondroitin sulfate synthase 2-like isoform X2 [Denticeps clupeoides]